MQTVRIAALTAACLYLSVEAFAQGASAPETTKVPAESIQSAPTPPAAPAPVKLEHLLALAKPDVRGTDNSADGCSYSAQTRKLPSSAAVVMTRKVVCKERYRSERAFIEVLYDGKPYLVGEEDLTTKPEHLAALASRSQADIEFNRPDWELESKNFTLVQRMKVLDKLKKSQAQGIAVISASIFDVSEYTEGTGFRVEVYNSGKKAIKYVTFGVRGLNAVRDPVRDRLSRSTTANLRGIGPIEAGEQASYKKDYMWMTDVVQFFDIDNIKLEFMDGSSRTVSGKQLVWLSVSDRETLLGEDE